MRFVKGDWVVFDPGYGDPEMGRVAADHGKTVFVCFGEGCTAAATDRSALRLATDTEISRAPKGIGYHRFSKGCPVYDPDVCGAYCPEKAVGGDA